MAEEIRKPFQGVWNIIRFNRHFYVPAVAALFILGFSVLYFPFQLRVWAYLLITAAAATVITTLLISYIIYDRSGFYQLSWLQLTFPADDPVLVNIHSGFDETSHALSRKYPTAQLTVMDFYDPIKHTETAIKRARKAYPPYPGTIKVKTDSLPLADSSADHILLTFAAHEIRDQNERNLFFRELFRMLKPGGCIVVTEHLRDLPNFLAYNIGFFHFLSQKTWQETFKNGGWNVSSHVKFTPFVSIFTLTKHGTSS